jgi:hypothetical protein
MATYRIYFFGLICHVGEIETEKKFAAVVKAEGHSRYIETSAQRYPIGDNVKKITFKFGDAADPKGAATTHLFAAFVPRLKDLMGGTIENDNVLLRHATKVEYPASVKNDRSVRSSLTTALLYERRAVHIGGGKILRPEGCVGRLNELTVNRPETTMKVYADDTLVTTITA